MKAGVYLLCACTSLPPDPDSTCLSSRGRTRWRTRRPACPMCFNGGSLAFRTLFLDSDQEMQVWDRCRTDRKQRTGQGQVSREQRNIKQVDWRTGPNVFNRWTLELL
ncbi:hypothetical protein QQF64_023477 [Cirrhinus molitorella]|uniref:Uncharacterized protein n=1 Tax=Cirrhinus molitorella TaxID=172907 RepID=A0ABR3L7M3_9TELE